MADNWIAFFLPVSSYARFITLPKNISFSLSNGVVKVGNNRQSRDKERKWKWKVEDYFNVHLNFKLNGKRVGHNSSMESEQRQRLE